MKNHILFSNRNWKHELKSEIEKQNSSFEKFILQCLRGVSPQSDASKDPFKFLGEYSDPNGADLLAALDGLHSTNRADGYEGVWRFTVLGKPSMLYNFSMSYTNDRWVQGLITVYRPNTDPQYTFGIDNRAHFLYRYFDGTSWGKWHDAALDNEKLVAAETARATAAEATKKAKRNYVKVDGETATIISKYNKYWDIVVTFKKVLKNELYSIEKVFLAENHGSELSTEVSDRQHLLCAQETSDMIGPVMVNRPTTGKSWVGGNHLYMNQQSGVKSAATKGFSIYADDKLIDEGAAYADVVTVKVENSIFDPDVAPASGATVLSSPMITEHVSYRINGGEVCVGVEHRYLKDVSVGTYYGMQSMFLTLPEGGSTAIMKYITAQGGVSDWRDWIIAQNAVYIKKADAPRFNRFSQKREADGYCQNTVLLPYGLGNHAYTEDNVFVYSGNKAYHVLVQDKAIAQGEVLSWMGVYNWNRPIADDEFNYVYDYNDINRRCLSVTAKKAYGGVSVPAPAYAVNSLFKVTEVDDAISVGDVVVGGFSLSATAQGSIKGTVLR